MSIEVARLYALIEADTKKAESNLRSFDSQLNKTAKSADDLGRTQLKSLQGGLQGIGGALGSLGLGIGMAGLATGAVSAGGAMLKLAMDAEQTGIAFTTMLKDGEKATKFLQDLRAFASETPFQFTDLTESSKKMMALGFSAEQVLPTLRSVGDAAAALGGGAPLIDQVTRALGQMQSKGKVSAEEMLQLAEAGIPAWKYLSEALGVTTGEAMKLAEKGLIPVDTAMKAIIAGMDQDFGGMMAKQSETAAGKLSNLIDKMEELGTKVGKFGIPLSNWVVDGLGKAADATNLLIFGNQQITDALAKHHDEVAKTSNSYADYVAEVTRAEVSAGRMSEKTRESIIHMAQQESGMNGVATEAEQLARKYANLTESQITELVINGELTEAQAEMVTAFRNSGQAANFFSEQNMGLLNTYGILTQSTYDVVQASDSVTDAHDRVKEKVKETADVTIDLTDHNKELKDSMAELSAIMRGEVGRAEDDHIQKNADLRLEMMKVNAELEKLQAAQGKVVTVTHEATGSTAELFIAQSNAEEAARKLADAQAKLAENTDPAKQHDLQLAVAEQQVAYDRTRESVEKLGGSVETYTVNNKKKIDELTLKQQELQKAYDEEAKAHEERTARIVFDLLQQKVVADGVQDGDITFLAEIGKAWGIYDEKTASVMASVDEAITEHGTNAVAVLNELNGKIKGLPDVKNIAINIQVNGPLQLAQTQGENFGWNGSTPTQPTDSGNESNNGMQDIMPGSSPSVVASSSTREGGAVWNGDLVVQGADSPRETAEMVLQLLADRGIVPASRARR